MASNITGQLLGLISAGSAFMGNARREAAMSEKRYETKEAATKAAEQKQIAAEQKAQNKEAEAAQKATEKQQRQQDRENKHQQRRQEAMEDFAKKQGIKADTAKTIAENKSQIKQQEEEASGKTAARNALAAKREAEGEKISAQGNLINAQAETEKQKGTTIKKDRLHQNKMNKIEEEKAKFALEQMKNNPMAHSQEIAELHAKYTAQQSQEQNSAQKEVMQTLLKDTKNIK